MALKTSFIYRKYIKLYLCERWCFKMLVYSYSIVPDNATRYHQTMTYTFTYKIFFIFLCIYLNLFLNFQNRASIQWVERRFGSLCASRPQTSWLEYIVSYQSFSIYLLWSLSVIIGDVDLHKLEFFKYISSSQCRNNWKCRNDDCNW